MSAVRLTRIHSIEVHERMVAPALRPEQASPAPTDSLTERVRRSIELVFGSALHEVPAGSRNARGNAGLRSEESRTGDFPSRRIREIAPRRFEVVLSDLHPFCPAGWTGIVEAAGPDQIVRLTEVVRRMVRLEQESSELAEQSSLYMERISTDLEEITWLRGLASTLARTGETTTPSEIGNDLLPGLLRLIKAEAVVLVRDTPVNRHQAIGREPIGYAGPHSRRSLFEGLALELISVNSVEARRRAVVRNSGFRLGKATEWQLPAGIHGCVVVPAGTKRHHFGWLVALNRVQNKEPGATRSEHEFGTYEATLMTTFAVILATHAANTDLLREKAGTLVGVVRALANALDARDHYTHGHSDRVARVARLLAARIGLDTRQCEHVYLAGLLHDVGKIGVPDEVLLKPGRLTDDERAAIERHPVIGQEILRPVPQLQHVLPGVMHHHERIDGNGYPARLSGTDIPISGRLIAVADAWDAMTTSRPYRNAMAFEEAAEILRGGSGSAWDSQILSAFFDEFEQIRQMYERHQRKEEAGESHVSKGADEFAESARLIENGLVTGLEHG